MSLTTFGYFCRQHRIRIGVVMADQSKATEFSSAFISEVERGEVSVTDDYLNRLVEWLQLDRLEALQLRTLARHNVKRFKKSERDEETNDLKALLNTHPRRMSDDEGTKDKVS